MHEQEQANVLRRFAVEILKGSDLADDADVSLAFRTPDLRQQFARQINSRAAEISADLPFGTFLGVVNEVDLGRVMTVRDLVEVLLRHTSGDLEDDTWSAF